MCQLFETIKVYNSKLYNLHYHNLRFNRSRNKIFGIKEQTDLGRLVNIPDNIGNTLYKCRIIYSEKIDTIEFLPYKKQLITSLRIVFCDNIIYDCKYTDRSLIDKCLDLKGDCDEILIVKNNKITDTSFANMIFFDGNKWITPSTPLLLGTKREKLLKEKKIAEKEIKIEDLDSFIEARLINAMIEFEDSPSILMKNIKL